MFYAVFFKLSYILKHFVTQKNMIYFYLFNLIFAIC